MKTANLVVRVKGNTLNVPIRWGPSGEGVAELTGKELGSGVSEEDVVAVEDWVVVLKRLDHVDADSHGNLDRVVFFVR